MFQPHRYTRTQHLWEEFRQAFNQADILLVSEIYAAGEAPIDSVTGESLALAICSAGHKNVIFTSTAQPAIEFLLREARPGDAIMTIGAGSISRVIDQIAVLLGAQILEPHAN
jgi:UDP-N-acetylmuramate--alanine ligase